MIVSRGGKNLYDAVPYLYNRHVKCSSAQIVYKYLLRLSIVKTIGESRRCRLIYDSKHIQSRYSSGVLCSLSLAVVKISRNCYDCIRYRSAQITLSIALQLCKYDGRYLLRRIVLAVYPLSVCCSHRSLDGCDSSVHIHSHLSPGSLTHQSLSILCDGYYGRCGPDPLRIRYDGWLIALKHCHTTVCCSQIYSYYSAHICQPLCYGILIHSWGRRGQAPPSPYIVYNNHHL